MTVGSFGWQLHSPGRWSSPAKLSWSCLVKYWVFKLLAGLLYCCSRPWAVSCELWAAKTWCVSCTLHLTSSILHLTKNVSYILHLDPCILHLASDKNSGLYLASCCSCAGLLCQLWQLGTQCQPTKICYHAFVPNILWLLVFDCSCLEVWPFDREAWLVWLSLQWCELVFFSKNKTDEKELGVIVMWMIITSVFHKCLITSDFQWTLSDASCWVSWSRQRSLIEICFHLLIVSQPYDCHGN